MQKVALNRTAIPVFENYFKISIPRKRICILVRSKQDRFTQEIMEYESIFSP